MSGETVNVLAPDPSTGRMRPATVAVEDLAQAKAAGALEQAPEAQYEKEIGGRIGQAATFALGAGRTASFGLLDGALVEGANIVGGDEARREMLHGLNVARDTNKYANLGGEAAGLLVGAGEGISGAGSIIEEHAAHALGGGLLGSVGGMAARGAGEGAMLGTQHQISEDTLGDVDYNGEKLFATASKDALLGAAIGAPLGALGHFGSLALATIRKAPGPSASAALDELAGVPGAGRQLRDEVATQEALIKDLQKVGATSEQAATMSDEIGSLARARTAGGPLSGLVDDGAARFAAAKAGGNEELQAVLERGYADLAKKLAGHDGVLDQHAKAIAEKGTAIMRGEDTLNKINFTERPDQFAKLLDPSKITEAADASTRMTQEVDALVTELEGTAMKGGSAVGVGRMRKMLTDTYAKQARFVEATTEAAQRETVKDLYMSTYKLKQEVGKLAGFGKAEHLRGEGEQLFSGLYEKLRTGLEDESVWGKAGAANREWNEVFSQQLPRRQDFGSKFGVSIDQAGGVPRPEVDFDKARAILNDLRGGEIDDIRQGVKSADSFVEGNRARIDAIQKYADLTPGDHAALSKMTDDLNAFESTFAGARKEAAIVGRLRTQAAEEQGHALGGVLGLATDVMTRPLQTMERLGMLKHATEKFEKGIENGINRFFEGKGTAFMRRAEAVVDKTRGAARPAEAVAKEIGDLRELVANQPALELRVQKMLGDTSEFAPKTAASAATVAMRAITYLATQLPEGRTDVRLGMTKPITRYSSHDLAVYENKRNAALHPETVVEEMRAGKLNRDGIRAVEAVCPRLFAEMQEMARTQLFRMEQEGKLDAMPYQQKAALATLLQVAPDGTWKPDFMALMQSTKVPSQQPAQPKAQQGGGRRPIKLDTDSFATEAEQVEGRTT